MMRALSILLVAAVLALPAASRAQEGGAVEASPLPVPRGTVTPLPPDETFDEDPAAAAEDADPDHAGDAPLAGDPGDDVPLAEEEDVPAEALADPDPDALRPIDRDPVAGVEASVPHVLPVLPSGAAEAGAAAYVITDGRRIDESLTGHPGDPVSGRALYADGARTGCVGCHGPADWRAAPPPPAPPLLGLAGRMREGEIRLWLVAPQVLRPGTGMPGFHQLGQRADPRDPGWGGPKLSAGEIEDIVAFLMAATAP